METSTLLMNNHIYAVKDAKLTDDYNVQRRKFDAQVDEARGINSEVTEGKRLIAETITSKNVITEPDDTFETMADNVLAIKSQLGYTPPAQAGTGTKPYTNFICEYPYRKYIAVREAGSYNNMINMPVNYQIPANIALKLSIISRVKRLNDNWSGVYIVGNKASNHSEDFVIQLISDTQLAYHSNRKVSGSSYYDTDTRVITIPSIASWEELVLEFKYSKDINGVINTSINIAQVLDDKIQEFIEVQSDSNLTDILWAFSSDSTNSLMYLSSEYTEYEVAPSAVNCKDMAFVVNDKIYSGNTSLYEFPEDFTIA